MKVAYTTLFLCITAYAYNRKSVNFVMPEIIEEGLDESQAGLVITCQNIGFALSKFIVGVLSDRCSPGLLFLSGLMLSGIVAALFARNAFFSIFCALWFVNGLAQGANWPPVVKIIQQKTSPSRFGTLCSLLLSGNNLANCVSPVLSAYIVYSYSWRTSVCVAGITSMILCFFSVFGLQMSDSSRNDSTKSQSNSSADPAAANPKSPSDPEAVSTDNRLDSPASPIPNSQSKSKTLTKSNNLHDTNSLSKHEMVTRSNSLTDPASSNPDLQREHKTIVKNSSSNDSDSEYCDLQEYKIVSQSYIMDAIGSAKADSIHKHEIEAPSSSLNAPASPNPDLQSEHKSMIKSSSTNESDTAYPDLQSEHKTMTQIKSKDGTDSAKGDSPNKQKTMAKSGSPNESNTAYLDLQSENRIQTKIKSTDGIDFAKSDSPNKHKTMAKSSSLSNSDLQNEHKTMVKSRSLSDPASSNPDLQSKHKTMANSSSLNESDTAYPDLQNQHEIVTQSNGTDDIDSAKADSSNEHKKVTQGNSKDDSAAVDLQTVTPSNIPIDSASSSADSESRFAGLLKDPFLWLVSTAYLVVSCYHTTLLDWGEVFLITERGRTKKEASFFISSMEIGGFFGGIVGGYLTDLFIVYRKKASSPKIQVTSANSRFWVLGIFMLIVVAFLHLLHSTIKETSSFAWIVCLGCSLGIFVYGSDAIIGVVSSECAPAHLSGSALAVSSLAGNVGAMITGYPFCTIAKYFSWTAVFVILEVMTLLMLCAIIGCKNLQPKHLKKVKTEGSFQVA